jgi:signal transduction histidine kinase
MKNKLALKLALYFSAALVLLAVIIGVVFTVLFREQTMREQKSALEARAVSIAGTLSDYMSGGSTANNGMGGGPGGNGMMGGGMAFAGNTTFGGVGMYLRFIDDIAMTDVWLVDESLNLITSRMSDYDYADLPPDAGRVVREVFEGKTTFSEGFGALLSAPTLTVGTPVTVNGTIVGAVLLHAPVKGLEEAAARGTALLAVSISAALVVALLLSVFLALSFTRPLSRMKNTALLLAKGDYSVSTGVSQKDELGALAGAIDILSDRLRAAKAESDRLDSLRRGFTANISHELRTPVTVLRGSLEALADAVVTEPEQVSAYYRQMLKESVFLERLVNDLLDLSKLQNTDFRMETETISLNELLADCARSARQIALTQGKNLDIRLDTEADAAVTGDYGRLRQMLMIILDNAVKFSPDGQAIVVAQRDRTVWVRDRGPGIAAEDLPYVFDRFYKVKSEENKNGTGLGLAIAKQIAERHHIEVSVTSRTGEGTAFIFRFPER